MTGTTDPRSPAVLLEPAIRAAAGEMDRLGDAPASPLSKMADSGGTMTARTDQRRGSMADGSCVMPALA
jgi:hypothetical protein